MITLENHLGGITISYDYLAALIARAASNCFGVAGMNPCGAKQNFLSLTGHTDQDRQGIQIRASKGRLTINLHITVAFGTNISAIVDSIVNKVRYTVEQETGLKVIRINVFVDGMRA